MRVRWLTMFALLVSACGEDEMSLVSLVDNTVSLEVRAPRRVLRGGCDQSFIDRFCAEEYEVIGVIDVSPLESRTLALADPVNDEQCTNVLWLRLVRLDAVGPVDDRGTLFHLPTEVEIEEGAGAVHGVAFPAKTVRLDQVGTADDKQAPPPATCAELGREAR